MSTTSAPDDTDLPGPAAQLSPVYEADRLAAELADLTGAPWAPQRTYTATGIGAPATIDWRVLPLRSPDGDPARTDPGGPGPAGYASTPWLDRLPYLRAILDIVPAPLHAVRLMALGPGAASHPHQDPKYTLARGLVRLHLPLVTHPAAVLVLDGVEHCWSPGAMWWGDFSREHVVRNSGPVTRVHAVIDALLTRELTEWFPPAWQRVLAHGNVLLSRAAPLTARCPVPLPHAAAVPEGFVDFTSDQPLDGDLQAAELTEQAQHVVLTVGTRPFVLAPTGGGEYRFVGWSEQRTIQPTRSGAVLRARLGRALVERHVPVPTPGGPT